MSFGSAFGQDRWIIDEVFEGKRGGWFVEAGALDGVNESNTVRLEREYGWTGLLVEPATAYFKDVQRQRKAASENACLYSSETEVDFLEAGGHGGIPSFFNASYRQKGRPTKKAAFRLETLLDKHRAPAEIDYLSLDTEGSEFEILKGFPFDRYRFLALTIEHNHHAELREALHGLLSKHGYVRVRTPLVDDWWLHETQYARVPEERRQLWKLLEKYPPRETALRAEETLARYEDLQRLTQSLSATAGLLFKQVRKRLRGRV